MFSTIIVKDLDERQNISKPISLVFPLNIGKSDIVLIVFVTIFMIAHTFLIRQAILKNKAGGRRKQPKITMPPTAKKESGLTAEFLPVSPISRAAGLLHVLIMRRSRFFCMLSPVCAAEFCSISCCRRRSGMLAVHARALHA
ncbi:MULTISPECIES: hypothetical protein [unclassified Paenibacillus]|uniref:hypothetical protein n=1 Tax=unclassified Paenibacillus TaxID=185978 RepID=UPI000970FD50|nr:MULTISPECIES: hypothetical protein [unclassified Paenibacillus]ASS66907.1 hypothetical protein CIC07_12730 [Paenibacillus sp. RUD330]